MRRRTDGRLPLAIDALRESDKARLSVKFDDKINEPVIASISCKIVRLNVVYGKRNSVVVKRYIKCYADTQRRNSSTSTDE